MKKRLIALLTAILMLASFGLAACVTTEPVEYSVTFNVDGGSPQPQAQSIVVGAHASQPTTDPAKTGHNFEGWFKEDKTTEFDFETEVINADTIVYAVYSPITYSVVYEKNGGDGANIAATAMTYGVEGNLSSAASWSKFGYSFAGWNTTADGLGTSYAAGEAVNNLSTVQGAEITLFAMWAPNSYVVRYYKNSEDATGNMLDTNHTYGIARSLATNAFINPGYLFQGWATTHDSNVISYTDGESVNNLSAIDDSIFNLYAVWEKAYIGTFAFSATDGEVSSRVEITLTENKESSGSERFMGTLMEFEDGILSQDSGRVQNKIYYTVDSATITVYGTEYAETSMFDLIVSADGATLTNEETELELTRTTEISTLCSINFRQTLTSPANEKTVYVRAGTLVSVSYTPAARDGYRFSKWINSDSTAATLTNITPTADVTVYGEWNTNTYTVAYDNNGGTGSILPQPAVYDANLTIKEITGMTPPTDMTFGWWNTKADGSGTSYAPNASVKNLTTAHEETVRLYAIWGTHVSAEVKYSGSTDTPNSSLDMTFKPDGTGTYIHKVNNMGVAREMTYIIVGSTWSISNDNGDDFVITAEDDTLSVVLTKTQGGGLVYNFELTEAIILKGTYSGTLSGTLSGTAVIMFTATTAVVTLNIGTAQTFNFTYIVSEDTVVFTGEGSANFLCAINPDGSLYFQFLFSSTPYSSGTLTQKLEGTYSGTLSGTLSGTAVIMFTATTAVVTLNIGTAQTFNFTYIVSGNTVVFTGEGSANFLCAINPDGSLYFQFLVSSTPYSSGMLTLQTTTPDPEPEPALSGMFYGAISGIRLTIDFYNDVAVIVIKMGTNYTPYVSDYSINGTTVTFANSNLSTLTVTLNSSNKPTSATFTLLGLANLPLYSNTLTANFTFSGTASAQDCELVIRGMEASFGVAYLKLDGVLSIFTFDMSASEATMSFTFTNYKGMAMLSSGSTTSPFATMSITFTDGATATLSAA